MKNYYPFKTIVAYRDKKVADRWVEEYMKEYFLSVKAYRVTRDGYFIRLHDDSIIEVVSASESARGKRADRVYIDGNVDEFIKDNVFYPIRISQPLIEI